MKTMLNVSRGDRGLPAVEPHLRDSGEEEEETRSRTAASECEERRG